MRGWQQCHLNGRNYYRRTLFGRVDNNNNNDEEETVKEVQINRIVYVSCIFKKNSSSAQSIFCLLSTEINTKFLNFRLTTKPITYSGLTPQSIHCPSTSSRKSHSRPRHWRFNSRKMNGERRTKIPVQ